MSITLLQIERNLIKAKERLPTGKVKIENKYFVCPVEPAGPLKVVLKVNGRQVVSGVVPVSAPLIFTANDCLDFGIDLGSPVGIEYGLPIRPPSNSTARSTGPAVEYLSGAPAQLQQEKLQTHGEFRSQD